MTRSSFRFRDGGFSLIELMVVVIIMGIVTAQMFLVFSVQKRTFLSNDRALDAQEGARLVSDLISQDARTAGFMVPPSAGVASFDGGGAAADRLCVSDSTIFSTPLDGTPSPLDDRISPFPGTAVTGVVATVITVPVGDLDIDGDGDVDFFGAVPPGAGNGSGIILSDGQRSHCAQIDTVAGGQISLVAAHAVAGGLFPVPGAVVAVPAIIYETDPAANTLLRNGVILAANVEDLQVEYWVDSQVPDDILGGTEFPVHNLNVPPGGWIVDLERIRRIQISVIMRSEYADRQDGVEFKRHRRPACANRAAGPRDEFMRRRFTVSALPRNMIND